MLDELEYEMQIPGCGAPKHLHFYVSGLVAKKYIVIAFSQSLYIQNSS